MADASADDARKKFGLVIVKWIAMMAAQGGQGWAGVRSARMKIKTKREICQFAGGCHP